MEHDLGIPQDDIGSSHQEIMALRARVETLEQQDRVTRDSLRIARGRITRLQLRAVAAEQQATDLQDSQVTDRLEITELRSQVEYAETRLERSHNNVNYESRVSFAEIEQIVAQRVNDVIEAIAIYETKIRVARDSMDRVICQGAKVAKNASNKRK
ncbi:hypothetical protein Tco_1474268 [Tanacetum coccineum]